MKGKTTHHTKPTETALHVSAAIYTASPTVFPFTVAFPVADETFCDAHHILCVTDKALFDADKALCAANTTSVAITKVLFAANKISGLPREILFAATQSSFATDKTSNIAFKVLFASTKVLFAAERLLCAATKTVFISDKVLYAANKTSNAANKIVFAAPDVPQPSTQRRPYGSKTTPVLRIFNEITPPNSSHTALIHFSAQLLSKTRLPRLSNTDKFVLQYCRKPN